MEGTAKKEIVYKVLLVGDSGVGKSNIVHRLIRNGFKEDMCNTWGVEFAACSRTVNGHSVRVQLWDTAGEPKKRVVTPFYYQGAHAVLLVYNVASRATFLSLPTWLKELKTHAPNACTLLVGNKTDLRCIQTVTTEEASEFSTKHSLLGTIGTSAKTGDNVEEGFLSLLAETDLKFGQTDDTLFEVDMTSEAPSITTVDAAVVRSASCKMPQSSWNYLCPSTCGLVSLLWSAQNVAAQQ